MGVLGLGRKRVDSIDHLMSFMSVESIVEVEVLRKPPKNGNGNGNGSDGHPNIEFLTTYTSEGHTYIEPFISQPHVDTSKEEDNEEYEANVQRTIARKDMNLHKLEHYKPFIKIRIKDKSRY
ncbi:hypothetical protein GOV05_02955 [Candidatus Woesearchaeota archaeon]|nr:hypothetical protein [Candidatus Woesearchaeota archaeon]